MGLLRHAAHTDVAKKDKHFRELNTEDFLRGDLTKQKATLGRLVDIFGDDFGIKTKSLEKLIDDRNLIVYRYYRVFVTQLKGVERPDGWQGFSTGFYQAHTRLYKYCKRTSLSFDGSYSTKRGSNRGVCANQVYSRRNCGL